MSKVTTLSIVRDEDGKNPDSLQDSSGSQPAEQTHLRKMCNSLAFKENQTSFLAFPESYCRDNGLTLEQIHAVTDLDILRLLDLGATISNLIKLTAIYELDVLELCSEQTGKSLDEVKTLISSI